MNGESYVNNSVFKVTLCDEIELSFSKISGIGGSVDFETYTEGGGRVLILPKPKSSAGTITFEKGLSLMDTKLATVFKPGVRVGNITIELIKNAVTVEKYNVEYGMITAWKLGDLDALNTGVAIKTFTLSHTGLKRVQ